MIMGSSGLTVGRIFGMRITIDWSWIFIFVQEEAFQAAWPALAQHAPSDEGETKPRAVHTLLSAL